MYMGLNWFGLWCLTLLSTIFQVAVSFFGGGNRPYTEKTTDMSQVTDKLYYRMLCRVQLA